MPKISAYPDFADESAYAILVDGGVNYKMRLDALIASAYSSRSYAGMVAEEFMNYRTEISSDQPLPWIYTAIGAGTSGYQNGEENHPGIARITSNGANTGASVWMGFDSNILLAGEEETDFIFKIPVTAGNNVLLGFGDDFTTIGAHTDAVYLTIGAASMTGRVKNNTVTTVTATSYAITENVWYRGKIVINSDASRVDFYLYDESGNLLWTDNLTGGLPTAAGRELTHGVKAYKVSAGVDDLIYLDYMSLFMPRALTR